MRLLLAATCASLIALTACTSTHPMSDPTPPTGGFTCNPDAARGDAMGQAATAEVVERARQQAGARTVRVLRPGQMVTMEYMEGRLNIDVDDKNVVTNVRCG